ncbi:hypothetical protein N0V90_007691 [Kalmusia sp. IMI 367209]|nr:hypothetical protein N0V90_007691 [Kalmusia sp. IMI 367209]
MLQADPRLAEVQGCSTEQLESLARSIDEKKQRLEADINAYIRQKQHELVHFQQELLAPYREMECGETRESANRSHGRTESQHASVLPESSPPAPLQPPETFAESKREEKAKRTKVHKREKELFGLVTPIFLPLLDASDSSKEREKKKRQKKEEEADNISPPKPEPASSSRDAEQREEIQGPSGKSSEKMDLEVVNSTALAEMKKENQVPESIKKSKRPAIKKSSLRHSGEKRRRKRVSLVIDGQTVLPADTVSEPQLMSPSETTVSSASNSTASLEDSIDPRLIGREDTSLHEHHDPMHHSLHLPTHLPSASPTKHTGHTLTSSPIPSPTYQSPPSHLEYEPPQTATRTYLDPSPPHADTIIPQYASAAPIYASEPEVANTVEDEFSTYVGGIRGSGVDDFDQTGSLGYPSSLGASYMESYMASRPLSVRMAAAEKAGLSSEERRRLMNGGRPAAEEVEAEHHPGHGRVADADDGMDIIGSMEDF